MSEFKLIVTSTIPEVTEVRWYDETIQHVNEEHPEVKLELPSITNAVEKAIAQPTQIELSDPTRHPGSFVYVDKSTTDRAGQPLRIPIKVIEGTSALLKTVFFSDSSSPNSSVIWEDDHE